MLAGVGRSLGVVDLGALRNVILVAGGRLLSDRVAACGGNAAAEVVDRRVTGAIVVDEEVDRVRQQRQRKHDADHQQPDGPVALFLLPRGFERGQLVAAALLARTGVAVFVEAAPLGAAFSSLLAFATWVYSYRSVSGSGESISIC